MFIDLHHIQAALAKKIVFTKAELDAADDELATTKNLISSVSRDGIFVGLTANTRGQRMFSAYAKGFWLSTLNTDDDGMTFVFDHITTPQLVMSTIGTDAEEAGRRISLKMSAVYIEDEIDFFRAGIDKDIDNLREIRIDGSTKSLNLTKTALDALHASHAGISSRANAIIQRYELLMSKPEMLDEIRALDASERK